MMLIALAGLNAIPNYIYEAAEIDRASRWAVFRRVTLPMCAPLLLLAVLFRTTDALKQFDLVMAITGPNDPATQTLSAQLYQISLRNLQLGLGGGYSVVVLVIVIAIASVFVRYLDSLAKKQGTSGVARAMLPVPGDTGRDARAAKCDSLDHHRWLSFSRTPCRSSGWDLTSINASGYLRSAASPKMHQPRLTRHRE